MYVKNVNGVQKAESFNSRLRQAVKSGNIETIRNLFAVKNFVNAKDAKGRTALHYAAMSSDSTKIVTALIQAGASCLSADCENKDARKYAAEANNTEALNVMRSLLGMTPFHIAAELGDIGQLATLLAGGADIESRDHKGLTPLVYAVVALQPEAVKFLLDQGASVNIDNVYDLSPIHWAAALGEIEMLTLLLKYGNVDLQGCNGITPLIFAVEMNQVDTIKLLLEQGANVNLADDDGYLPIHAAARIGEIEMVKMLLEAGASLDSRMIDGLTPLDFAVVCEKSETVQFILDNYANDNVDEESPEEWSDAPELVHHTVGVTDKGRYAKIKAILDCPDKRRWCCAVHFRPREEKECSKFFRPHHIGAVMLCVGHAADATSFQTLARWFLQRYVINFEMSESCESPVGSLPVDIEARCRNLENLPLDEFRDKNFIDPVVYLVAPVIARYGRRLV